MTQARLFHNADCSKCRAALALLLERGVHVEVVNYLENPPSPGELRALAGMLGLPARALLRPGAEPVDSERAPSEDDEAVLRLLADEPRRLQRPILVVGTRAVIARPPERVLELL